MNKSSRTSAGLAGNSAGRGIVAAKKFRQRFFTLLVALGLNISLALVDVQAKPPSGEKPVGAPSKARASKPAPAKAPPSASTTSTTSSTSTTTQGPLPTANSAASSPTRAATAAPVSNRWFAPLSGVAAGLGLSALASHFGFAEEIGSFLIFMLALAAVMLVVRFLLLPRRAVAAPQYFAPGYSYSGVGQEAMVALQYPPSPSGLAQPRAYPAVSAGLLQRRGDSTSTWQIPADFDVGTFLRQSKSQYVRLQAAHDSADLERLRDFTTPELFDRISAEIETRPRSLNKSGQIKTDIIALKAELLGVNSDSGEHMACVRFLGYLREQAALTAEPFDEVWNLKKPFDGSQGWLLADVQQLSTVE